MECARAPLMNLPRTRHSQVNDIIVDLLPPKSATQVFLYPGTKIAGSYSPTDLSQICSLIGRFRLDANEKVILNMVFDFENSGDARVQLQSFLVYFKKETSGIWSAYSITCYVAD